MSEQRNVLKVLGRGAAGGIDRRTLLTVLVAALGTTPRWSEASHQARRSLPARGAVLQPSRPITASRWSDAAVKELRQLQETAYLELGARMRIPGDASAVYRRLTLPRMPAERISPERFREAAGGRLDPDAMRAAEKQLTEYNAKYGNVQPPTPYEDPTLYMTLLEMSDSMEAVWSSVSNRPMPRVLLGTVPTATIESGSGIINAEIKRVMANEYIIVFQRGLFDFAYEMAKLAAGAVPPLDQRGAFTRNVDVSAAASNPSVIEQFHRILHAYVVLGESRRIPPYEIDKAREFTAGLMIRSLELFVLGHEYGHPVVSPPERSLGPAPADPRLVSRWNNEYAADEMGVRLTHAGMGNLSLTFWGAVQFFSCMEAFRRALSILRTGAVGTDSSGGHPPSPFRAQYLSSVISTLASGAESKQAIQLGAQLDVFWRRLWQAVEPRWVEMYKGKKERPSEIWS
jgi:hypothetical protein